VKEKTVASVTGTDASETLDRADGVTDNADTILGLGGNDTIFGLGGSDYIKGGGGADRINGGGGIDTASYSDSDEGVFVDLDFGLGAGGTAEGDVLTSIENLEGSPYGDFLGGNNAANVLKGLSGDDHIEGGGGGDTLDGGAGIDTAYYNDSGEGVSVNLRFGTGNNGTADGDELISIENLVGSDYGDFLIGNDADNVIRGGGGNDFLLRGGAGADTIDRGSGIDEVNYLDSDAGVNVNLLLGQGTGGTAEGDVLISIEDLQGSQFGDVLRGNASANLIDGNSGSDFLYGEQGADSLDGDGGADHIEGGAGADTIRGGINADLLIGGADADSFFFFSGDSGRYSAGQADVIADFVDADQIYLQGFYEFAGGGAAEPGENEYVVYWNSDANGWILSWNDGDFIQDALVHGDNPLGDISFFT
jgi:Ca2+-binding RTX toxin-like protein